MAKKAKLTMEQIEKQLPKLAASATGSAYKRAVRSGSVVVYRDGDIRRIAAGGQDVIIKKIEPRIRIAKGSRFELEPETA
jgi:hypothetical protein